MGKIDMQCLFFNVFTWPSPQDCAARVPHGTGIATSFLKRKLLFGIVLLYPYDCEASYKLKEIYEYFGVD